MPGQSLQGELGARGGWGIASVEARIRHQLLPLFLQRIICRSIFRLGGLHPFAIYAIHAHQGRGSMNSMRDARWPQCLSEIVSLRIYEAVEKVRHEGVDNPRRHGEG